MAGNVEIPFQDPMNFGMGIDSLTLRPRNTVAVIATPLKTVEGTGEAQTVEFSLISAEKTEDYEETLSISAEASASYGFFGGGSASFEFGQRHKLHSYSRFLIIRVTVTNAFKQIATPKLNPDTSAISLLQRGLQKDFQTEFGDQFVLGIKQGGVYFALIEFTTKTKEDLETIGSKLSTGVFGVFSGAAAFSKAVSQYTGETNLRVDSFQQGGTDATPAINFDDAIAKALAFPNQVKQAALSYSVRLQEYNTLDLPAPPNQVDIDNARDVITRYNKLRTQLVQLLNDIDYIRLHPDQFVKPEDFPLQKIENQLTEALNTLKASASKCANDINNCTFLPLEISEVKLPERIGKKQLEETLASKGAVLAKADSLADLLREQEPEGPSRRGFDIGMAVAEGQTLPGPGKDAFGDALALAEQRGFKNAVIFSVDRNRNLNFASKGAQVVKNDPDVAIQRSTLPLGLSWLGFNIASGIFGDQKSGGAGHTLDGPGALKIQDELNAFVREGFIAGKSFHLGRVHK